MLNKAEEFFKKENKPCVFIKVNNSKVIVSSNNFKQEVMDSLDRMKFTCTKHKNIGNITQEFTLQGIDHLDYKTLGQYIEEDLLALGYKIIWH